MTAYVSEELLEEWVVDRYFLSMAHSYRSHREQGTHGEFLQKLLKVLKRQSPRTVAVWKEFVEGTVSAMDKSIEEYKQMQADFGKPKPPRAATRRRK